VLSPHRTRARSRGARGGIGDALETIVQSVSAQQHTCLLRGRQRRFTDDSALA
jgi:hypothetical protein